MLAFASPAAAAAPPVQDITAFCAGGPAGDPFPDVPSGDVFHDEVACAKDAGLVNGKPDGLFHGLDTTSRAQMSSIVARADDTAVTLAIAGQTVNPLPAAGANPYQDVGDPPPDGGTPTAPHTNNILRLTTANIVQGKSANTFDPSGSETRFQLIKTIVGSIEFVTNTTLDDTCGITFADGAENDATFGEFVKKAGCAGIVQGKSSAASPSGSATNGNLGGGENVDRYQTAAIGDRGLAFLNAKGFINTLHGGGGPGVLTVGGGSLLPLTQGTSTVFNVTGADPTKHYDIQLFDYHNAPGDSTAPSCSSSGGNLFPNSSNPGLSTGNFAVQNPTAVGNNNISFVNGATEPTGQKSINGVSPDSNGNINFTVQNNDNGTAAPSLFCAVVFEQGTGANPDQIQLGANNMPVNQEAGVATLTAFFPAEASSGNFNNQFVLAAVSVLKEFVACAGPTGQAPCRTYHFSSNANVYNYSSPAVALSPDGVDFGKFISGIGTSPNLVLGDGLNIGYVPPTDAQPNTVSTFTFNWDTPGQPTDVTAATANISGTPAVQVTGTAPPNLDVTSASNPGSIQIFRATVTNGVVGPFSAIGLVNGNQVTSGFTFLFNDLNPPSGTYEYEAVAVPNAANDPGLGFPFQPGNPSEPSQPSAPITFTNTATALTPVILQTTYTKGSGQNAAQQLVLSPGAPASGQQADTISLLLANCGAGCTVANNASILIGDTSINTHAGNEVMLTNGVNSNWTSGAANTVNIVVTGAPTPVAGGANVLTASGPWAINHISGITNSAGDVNEAVSGDFAPGILGLPAYPSLTRMIDTGANFCGAGAFVSTCNFTNPPLANPEISTFFVGPGSAVTASQCAAGNCGDVWYNQNTNQLTIQPGLSGGGSCCGGQMNAGDPFEVQDFNGNVLASGTYNNAGQTVTLAGATIQPGSPIYFLYQSDGVGTGNGNISISLRQGFGGVVNPSPIPKVQGVAGAGNTLVVSFCDGFLVPNVTLNGPASNWKVFDQTDSTLQATGTNVVVDPNNGCSVDVTLNNPLALGSVHFLQVAPNSVNQKGDGAFIQTTGQGNVAQNVGPWTANGTPPVVTFTGGPTGGATTNDPTPTWTWTVTDATGTVDDANTHVIIDGVDQGPATAISGDGTGSMSVQFTPGAAIANGAHTIKLTSTDSNGVTGSSSTEDFTEGGTAASAANSSVNASPSTNVPDDNNPVPTSPGSSVVTVTLLDASSNPVAGKQVSLAPTTNGAGGLICDSNGTSCSAAGAAHTNGATTDGAGQVQFRVSNNAVQTVTYTATDTTDGVVVTDTATVAYIAPAFTSASGTAGGTTITVNFNDQICRTVAFAAGDWTVSGSVSGAQTVTGDNIPVCNGTKTNGVTTATLSLSAPLPAIPQTWTVTNANNAVMVNHAAIAPASVGRTFNT